MNHGSHVLVCERLSRMFPGFVAGQSASLLELTAMVAEIPKCCPSYVGQQLLFGAKCCDENVSACLSLTRIGSACMAPVTV